MHSSKHRQSGYSQKVVYGHKTEERVKAMKSEIKENVQQTNSEGKETGTQIKGLEQKEFLLQTFNQTE